MKTHTRTHARMHARMHARTHIDREHLPLVKLDSSTLYLLQRKSVAAISNYAGYEGMISTAAAHN